MPKAISEMIKHVFLLVVLALVCSSCGNQSPPATATPLDVVIVINPDIENVSAGQTVAISVNTSGQGLQFKWSVSKGTLSASDMPAVIYTAPDIAGLDTVTVEVSSATGTTTKTVSFNVIVPPTETPVPTTVPTDTPIPPPVLEVFPQAADGQEFAFVNKGGVLMPQFVTDKNCVHSGLYGLRLMFDMQGQGNGGWGVHWVNPPIATHFDASEFRMLTFWVRGMLGDETFQVAMKDTNDKSFWLESKSVLVVTQGWMKVSVPISKFQGVNTSSLENLTFGSNNTHGSGSICIDDIAFAP